MKSWLRNIVLVFSVVLMISTIFIVEDGIIDATWPPSAGRTRGARIVQALPQYKIAHFVMTWLNEGD